MCLLHQIDQKIYKSLDGAADDGDASKNDHTLANRERCVFEIVHIVIGYLCLVFILEIFVIVIEGYDLKTILKLWDIRAGQGSSFCKNSYPRILHLKLFDI